MSVTSAIIDDLSREPPIAAIGSNWQLLTDQVMGGVSKGTMVRDAVAGRPAVRMRGDVSLENNGGFVQIALDLSPDGGVVDASAWSGIELDVFGNGEEYGVHLRTDALTRPWQSYRQSFKADAEWRTVQLPFDHFVPHRTDILLDTHRLRRIGLVAEAVASEAKGLLPWDAGHHVAFRRLNGHRRGLSAICEDLPEEHNRVTLDPVLTDSHGIPAPRIDYRIGENTARMMEHGIARAKEVLAAAEATDICVNSPILYGGWHLLGTARMGADRACSVVNPWGRSHDVKNLFIVDGSLFVTSGGVNPTSTIQALALYIADQMKQRLANLFD